MSVNNSVQLASSICSLSTEGDDLIDQETVSRILAELLDNQDELFDSEDDDISSTNDYSSINEQVLSIILVSMCTSIWFVTTTLKSLCSVWTPNRRCFASSDKGEELQLQTPNPFLKGFFLMAQRQNVAFNSARNGGGRNSFWADAQRQIRLWFVKIKILEHHQTVEKIVRYNNLMCSLSQTHYNRFTSAGFSYVIVYTYVLHIILN